MKSEYTFVHVSYKDLVGNNHDKKTTDLTYCETCQVHRD